MENQTTNTQPIFIPKAQEETVKEEIVQKPIDIGHNLLLAALYFVFDAFDRCSMTFFLVKDTAKNAKTSHMLEGDHIDIGVRKLEWSNDQKDVLFLFLTQENAAITEELPDKITLKWNDVPIVIHLYDDSPCVTALVPITYEHEIWLIPNQFEEFEKTYDK